MLNHNAKVEYCSVPMTGRSWTQFEQYMQYNSGTDCPINSSWTQYNQQGFSDYIYQWWILRGLVWYQQS